jgi:hypothetical protein
MKKEAPRGERPFWRRFWNAAGVATSETQG